MRRFSRLYGASPIHAVGMLVFLGAAGYVVSRVLHASHPGWIALWLIGAVVAHDMVLFPLYTALHRLVFGRRRGHEERASAVPWKNHVRVPVVLSGVLLLISFPLVFGLSDRDYAAATGLHPSVYLGRWLLVCGCLFAGSGVIYVARMFARRGGSRVDADTENL